MQVPPARVVANLRAAAGVTPLHTPLSEKLAAVLVPLSLDPTTGEVQVSLAT